jgi:DNA-binding response OmpR family regulator
MTGKDYSLLILDVKMPGLDGFEVLKRVRQDMKLPDLPIIMLTAMGSENDIIKAYDLGADDYILKPYSAVQLVARVKTLLRKP